MAGEDAEDIRQRIILLGADEALKELQTLGDEGAKAIDQIKKAGSGDFAQGLRALSPTIAEFQDSVASAVSASQKLPGTLGQAVVAAQRLGRAGGPRQITRDLNDAADASAQTSQQLRGLALTLRGLGRATGIREISQFSRIIRGLGVNVALIGPALAVLATGGLAAVADSAAQATQTVQDLAFAVGQVPQIFQSVANAAVAVGGSVEKFGAAIQKQPALIKDTAQQERALTAARENLVEVTNKNSDAAQKTLDALIPLAKAQHDLTIETLTGAQGAGAYAQKQADLFDQFRLSKIGADQYNKSVQALAIEQLNSLRAQTEQQAALDRQVQAANQAIAEQDAQARRAEKSAREAIKAQEENATALQKLGIASQQFKNLKLDERFALVAEKLIPMEKGLKRNQIALEIFGEDARKFINDLDAAGGSFEAFRAEGDRVAGVFEKAQLAVGDQFVTALGKLTTALGSLKDAFGLAVAPAFIDFFNLLTDAAVALRPILADFGKVLGSILKPALDGIGVAITLIVSGIQLLAAAFNQLAEFINTIFGTNLTGAQLFLSTLIGILAIFAPITTGIILIITTIGLLSEVIKTIDFKSVLDGFNSVVDSIVSAAVNLMVSVVKVFDAGAKGISSAFDTAISFITGLWDQFKSFLASWVTSVVAFFQPLIDVIKKISAFFATGATDQAAAGGTGFAEGGYVRGPGTPTSDSILALLSDQEFVMRARAVKKYGLSFMNALNQGRIDFDSFRGFSLGGLVTSALGSTPPVAGIPRFADGGPVIAGQGLKPVMINFEGTKFSAMMEGDALTALGKRALEQRAKRAGRRPSFVGS